MATLKDVLPEDLYQKVQTAIDERNAGETDKTKHIRFADLSEGGYVSADKFNDRVTALTQQVQELQEQISGRDTDITGLREKLTQAQTDAGKLLEAQNALASLQSKYDGDKQAWEARAQKQAYEFNIRERANGISFSSTAAKRDFIREATAKKFKQDGDILLGYEDFVAKYKEENPDAFQAEGQPAEEGHTPRIVAPKSKNQNPNTAVFGFHFNGVRPHDENG